MAQRRKKVKEKEKDEKDKDDSDGDRRDGADEQLCASDGTELCPEEG